MTDRRAFSEQRLAALSEQLTPVRAILDKRALCVYATGSYGRLEASEHSDVDLFFLHDDQSHENDFPFTDLVRVMNRVVEGADALDLPPFSGDGRFLTIQSVAKFEEVLGSPEDDRLNAFTARLLLLLESQPIGDEELYERLLARIISFYYRDFDDHAEAFVPTFLLNDVLRFWRTLTLNYEHHRLKVLPLAGEARERKKADSALKNYKLRVSRMTTCFSMAIHLGAAPVPVTQEQVLTLCRSTPSERLLALAGDHRSAAASVIDELATHYETFLTTTQRPDAEAHDLFLDPVRRRQALEDARVYGDLIFQLIQLAVPAERFRYFVV